MIQKAKNIENILKGCPKNEIIRNNLIKAYSIINDEKYRKVCCAVSGGADSDVMLDICYRCDKDNKIDYIWFDTGLELSATKEHLAFLESKYDIQIRREKAIKSVPLSCKEYGQPFISKIVSQFIHSCQIHDFKFEDKPYEKLKLEYPKISTTLKWWCNVGNVKMWRINQNKWLKEFLILNPPNFRVSANCCTYAKKKPIHQILESENYDLQIIGVRRAEGGARAVSYKSCYDERLGGCDYFRPLFWYTDKDKQEYEQAYGIVHSKCYTEYGMKRTGCVGCPFNRKLSEDLTTFQEYEPNMYKAACHVFKDSYEYTKKYREFYSKMQTKEKMEKTQKQKENI